MLAVWAADCAERVLPLFEKMRPKDKRPREAIKACRRWVRTGIFRMADIRKASLGAHSAAREAAREAKGGGVACFAARKAGREAKAGRVVCFAARAAGRKAKDGGVACFAARAAGHSVATAHVPEHAFGSSYYAIKALEAADSTSEASRRARIARELSWQWRHLPKVLRKGWQEWQARKLPKAMRKRWREFLKKRK